MSQYTSFFLRSHGDEFLPIGTFSRCHAIAEFINDYAPWEKITSVSANMLTSIIADIDKEIKLYQTRIDNNHEILASVSNFNNSIEEKMEAISDLNRDIADCKEDIDHLNFAKGYFDTLLTIIGEADDTKYYEDESYHIDPSKYVYVGVEIGRPTVEDVRE